MTTKKLDYLREWGTRIANERAEFIGCLRASLRAGEITMPEATYAMGYAGFEINDIIIGTFELAISAKNNEATS